jgi:hypothetical protein
MFIPDTDLDFLPISDPEYRGQKGTGSRIRIRNTSLKIQKMVFPTGKGRQIPFKIMESLRIY